MSHLEENRPNVFEFFKVGGFFVQISEDNPFGGIPACKTIEETIKLYKQTAGGAEGFSLKPGAVGKYYLFRSIFMRQLKHMLHMNTAAKIEAKSLLFVFFRVH